MAEPGWYPDPAGQPGVYRWFDGRDWTEQTTGGSSDGQGTGGGGAGGDGPGGNGSGGGRGPGRIILGGIVVVLLGALVVWLVLRQGNSSDQGEARPDNNTSTPTVSPWNEKSSSPKAGSSVVKCPQGTTSQAAPTADGRLHSGPISVAEIDGWGDDDLIMPWVRQINSQSDVVYTASPTSWMSVSGVGQLATADGFSAPKDAARMMTQCFASSQYYSGYTGSKVVSQQEFERNGHAGWWIRSEIYVSMSGLPQVKGDVVDVVVMDTGNSDFLGVYFNSATIGDSSRQKLVDAARNSIQVS